MKVPKYIYAVALASALITIPSKSALSASLSMMGEVHTGNDIFGIYNNGLLNSDYSDGSVNLGGTVYDKDDWIISSVTLDLTGTSSGINLNNISFRSSWTDVHYTAGEVNGTCVDPEKGCDWTSVQSQNIVGYTGYTLGNTQTITTTLNNTTTSYNITDSITFNFDPNSFQFSEAIAFNIDYLDETPDPIYGTGANRNTIIGYDYQAAGADMNNFKVLVTYTTKDGKYTDQLVYDGGTFSGTKRSFAFDGTINASAYLQGDGNFSPESTQPPAVPEPATILGSLFAMTMGFLFKKKQRKSNPVSVEA